MLLKILLSLMFLVPAVAVHADSAPDRQKPVVLDENLWVTFYDLPSRRFRTIRAAILTRDYEAAARDLSVTANYLSVEANRASAVIQVPLNDVVARLGSMQGRIDKLTLDELDMLFGRAHWLLAQHYLDHAKQSRDMRDNRGTSLFLWATIHHMERAALWNNVPVTSETHRALEGLRKLAGRLQNPETSDRAYKDKPVVRAEILLRKIGKQIDRRILLPDSGAEITGPDSEKSTP